MSDTPAEMRDHRRAVKAAKGNCLITGLGLGMVVNACLKKPEVQSVTVIEADADVIALVAGHYQAEYGERFKIVHADALLWKPPPGARYGMVWHDIWPTISTDNIPQMRALMRRFHKASDWQDSWCLDECLRQKRREQREEREARRMARAFFGVHGAFREI